MLVAFLALGGVLVSVYMLLYKLRVLPSIACGTGGCEIVQASRYAMFLGVPVPAWGVLGYGLIMFLALAAVQPRLVGSRVLAWALVLLAGGAFLFSAYLTALEMWVIHAWCRWCIASAVIATLLFLCALPEIPRLRGVR
jgi:uncharacterized membrane protein